MSTRGNTGVTLALAAKAAAALIGLSLVAWLGTPMLQRRLMYFPDTSLVRPETAGLSKVEERRFSAADGTTGLAWYGRAEAGAPTILYFHGNAGALATRSERIRKYMAKGYGIYMMTYRGFGGRPGEPSEKANVADALAAYDDLVAHGVTAGRIVLYGESLGSGIAVQVAAQRPVAGIILDAPYTSMVDLAAVHHPLLPSRWLMTDRYETARTIGTVKAPLLIVHGEEDDIVPVEMGRALDAIANEPKTLVTLPGAGHSDHYLFGSYDVIWGWLEQLARARQ